MEKRNLTDQDFYQQACAYFYYHAEQRTTMINYFIAVFAACIALYGSLLEKFPLACLLVGIFLEAVSILFYKIDVRNKFDVKMSQHVICQYEEDYGVDKPEKDFSLGVFSDEDNVFIYYDRAFRKKNKKYQALQAAYKKNKDKEALKEAIREVADADPNVSFRAVAESLGKPPIAHLSTCIQLLYFMCMVISGLAILFAGGVVIASFLV